MQIENGRKWAGPLWLIHASHEDAPGGGSPEFNLADGDVEYRRRIVRGTTASGGGDCGDPDGAERRQPLEKVSTSW